MADVDLPGHEWLAPRSTGGNPSMDARTEKRSARPPPTQLHGSSTDRLWQI